MRNRITVVLCLLGLLAATASVGQDRDREETSKSFSFATYKEKDGPITVLLGSFPAAAAAEEPFFPVQIAIGFQGKKNQRLTITSESFVLIDPEGNSYPMAGLREVREANEWIAYSVGSSNAYHLETGQQFANSHLVESKFFPVASAEIRWERVELRRWNWTQDEIFFPRPALGLDGVLTLRFKTQEMTRPLDVRFKVPLKKKK